MTHTVTVLPGDGIGSEIMAATLKVLEATKVGFIWDLQVLGEASGGHEGGLPTETLNSIRRNKVAIKGPTGTPSGSGHRSLNVRLREEFQLFANVRPIQTWPGIKTRFSDVHIDTVLFRENLEDCYVGEERKTPDGAEGLARFTKLGCERIARFAYDYATKHNRRKMTIVTKSNIMKLTHGLFRDEALKASLDFSEIATETMIADAFLMKYVQHPEWFDCLVMPNFLGDLVSDLGAGLIGGLGFAPGANIGAEHAIFEAVHGTAPDIAGKGIANPTSLILSGAMMLDHLGEHSAAIRVRKAVNQTFLEGVVTGDVKSDHPASTIEFANAVIAQL